MLYFDEQAIIINKGADMPTKGEKEMFITIGTTGTGEEIIINSDNINRIYISPVNFNRVTPTPFKFNVYMNDGTMVEINVNKQDKDKLEEMLRQVGYIDLKTQGALINVIK